MKALLHDILSDSMKTYIALALLAMYIPAQIFLIVAYFRASRRAGKEMEISQSKCE